MDGRQAAANVLIGAVIGAMTPFAVALVMADAIADFQPRYHLITIMTLSIICGGVGVLVNLPWAAAPCRPHGRTGHGHRRRSAWSYEEPAKPGSARRGRRYSMSHGEAMRLLELQGEPTPAALRAAYRRLARRDHPDAAAPKGDAAVREATERFRRLREAYELLSEDHA